MLDPFIGGEAELASVTFAAPPGHGAPSGERYTLSDRVTGVVGSPVASARLYAVSSWTLLDPLDRFDLELPSDLSDITYQG